MKNVTIIKHSKLWFSISGAIILIGLIMMLVRGLNFGIDFTGGTMMQVDLGQTVSVAELQEVLAPYNLSPEIVHAGADKTEVIIKTKLSINNEDRMAIFNTIKTQYGLEDGALRSTEQFGPAIGTEIRNRAIMAILGAAVLMLIYITFRFELVFGLAAIVALLHDVLILISVYAIFSITVNSSFIAAVLTIVGYSINDTIVVFDRLRENVKREKNKKYGEIADMSIGQTLTRSINTSLTTMLVIGSLLVLGVDSIKEFALPLMAGVAVGTYSSIFIASPVWALIRSRKARKGSYATN
ncbi:protein translocase subunit SecF [Fusibacter paucivorans]|uniref:protein translocase subunit SecF n=1 Tax=Fusibacter paucivorans TaxID=76009 RepID=UPI001FE2EFEA|nr:protein translocase subunit SecF [Fusibacter paucivorans]